MQYLKVPPALSLVLCLQNLMDVPPLGLACSFRSLSEPFKAGQANSDLRLCWLKTKQNESI